MATLAGCCSYEDGLISIGSVKYMPGAIVLACGEHHFHGEGGGSDCIDVSAGLFLEVRQWSHSKHVSASAENQDELRQTS